MRYHLDQSFKALTICTGNVCRSPAAERLLRSEFSSSSGINVTSGGLAALVGEPIQPPMVRLLEDRGVEADGFAAQQVSEKMVNSADLILTATRRQRSGIVDLSPAAVRRTFTLREFARLASSVDRGRLDRATEGAIEPAARLAAVVPLAAAERREVAVELDDIVDPFRRSEAVYLEAFTHITEAVEVITQVVSPPTR